MEPIIQLKNITKGYVKGKEKVSIFNDLNISLNQGEFVALMGPSGSGKTTLLNLLGGIDSPDSGSIVVAGQDLTNSSESMLSTWRSNHIGFIFQFYHLMPMMSAEKNVALPLLLTSLSAKDRKKHVVAALSIVGLSERAKHLPRELSGGEEQRVAIARAIVSDPDILLCDEPTGDLDRETADGILNLLKMLNEKHGKTIVMVTHDPVAAEYARKTLRLDKGVFIEEVTLA